MKRIPIAAARQIAEAYGYSQVIIVARAVGENGGEHVTTYGIDKANCDVAASVGNFLKYKVMGWREENARATAERRCICGHFESQHLLSPLMCSDCARENRDGAFHHRFTLAAATPEGP